MNRALRITAAAAALASLLVACQLLVGVKDEEENLRPVSSADGGADANAEGGPAPDPCPHGLPPGPPATAPAQPERRHVLAVKSILMGGYSDLPRAFDFDRLCTCANRDERNGNTRHTSCKAPKGDRCDERRPNDDSEGRDLGGLNAFNRDDIFFNSVITGVERDDVNAKFDQGLLGFVMTMEGYNETPNDTKVDISFTLSSGIERTGDAGIVRPPGEACAALNDAGVKPLWEAGVDTWYTSGSASQGKAGWVTEGLLVVDNVGTSYTLPIGAQTLRQESPVFVGKVTPDGPRVSVRGNLVGIVSATSLLNLIGAFRDPINTNVKICESDAGLINNVKASICDARDLLERSTDPNRECDAFAIAIGIDLIEVQSGPTNNCSPLAASPCNERCGP